MTRRGFLTAAAAGVGAIAANSAAAAAKAKPITLIVDDTRPGKTISPYVFGSNEMGKMDGGEYSAKFDAALGITFRRLGGNRLSTYNWTSNNSNAGLDWRHSNDDFLAATLGLSPEKARQPAGVIAAAHESSLSMGARTLITVPLVDYVAADNGGSVTPDEAAPSKRFIPVRWTSPAKASDPIDESVCDIPHLLRRLTSTYGSAAVGGIQGYALDNEPGLWSQTHPRIVGSPVTIQNLIQKSLHAARMIKSIDPAALVFGPCSWGVTEMVTLQNAPDWPKYAHYETFLAAYLDAFAKESERAGYRLLDVLDLHWYPYSGERSLLNCSDPVLARALLNAPRSLNETGYRESSWVSRALRVSNMDDLALPILPSLHRLVERWFPGTRLSISEFNYGDGTFAPTALALADALGRLATAGIDFACHWGALSGYRGQAYKLFLGDGVMFGRITGQILSITSRKDDEVSAFASLRSNANRDVDLIVVNKARHPRVLDVRLLSGRGASVLSIMRMADHDAMQHGDADRPRSDRIVVQGSSAVRVLLNAD